MANLAKVVIGLSLCALAAGCARQARPTPAPKIEEPPPMLERDITRSGIEEKLGSAAAAAARRLGVFPAPKNPDPNGVLIDQVFLGTPAEKAGLRSGDVVTHLGEKRVKTPLDLVREVLALDTPTVKISLLRENKPTTLEVKGIPPIWEVTQGESYREKMGLPPALLPPDLQKELGLPAKPAKK